MRGLARGLGGALGTTWRAVRARPGIFLGVALAVVLFDLFLPLAVLSVLRKPWDYFSFNPWLAELPRWALSPSVPLGRKVDFLSNVALFWFVRNPYYAAEWGFSVGVRDVARWLYMGLVFGAYFALWAYARGGRVRRGLVWRGGRRSGVAGVALSTLGLATSPCSVAGCGLPVLPVMGLALQGLTSGTLAALTTVSEVATTAVLGGMTLAVVALAWIIDRHEAPRPTARAGAPSAGISQVRGEARPAGAPLRDGGEAGRPAAGPGGGRAGTPSRDA
jgi:hypothetical protein